jgi:hypothetical protein
MDTVDIISIIGLTVFGLAFGVLTANSSNKRDKLYGNQITRFFHYLSCSLMAALTPAVLVMALFMHPEWVTIAGISFSPLVQMLGLAVLTAIGAILCLIPYALLEKPAADAAKRKKDEQGWTAKDAKESGL